MLLEDIIDYSKDDLLTDFGKATLVDRYLKPQEKSPQEAFLRTSTAFASNAEHAKRMYKYASNQWIGYASPVLSNAPERTKFAQEWEKNFTPDCFKSVLGALPISCFVGYVPDSREGIGFHYYEQLWLASGGGGYKAYWGDLRPVNSTTSTGSKTGGLTPFFHVTDGMIVATHQGNNRRGVYGGSIRDNHPEIVEFIESRKMSGDPNKRSRNVFQTVNVSDAFMYAVLSDAQWALIDHEGNVVKTVSARYLWELMLETPFETGCPFLHFIDTSNDMLPSVQKALNLRVNTVNICCMAKDQRIATDQGLLTVEELFKSQYAPKVAGRGVISQGSNMMLPRPNAPMVKVTTKEGYSHKVTPDHRIWVVGKGWVEAQDIQIGDKIELQTQSLFGSENKPEEAFLAGLIAGDGTYSDNSSNVRIDLWKGKTDQLLQEVEKKTHSVLKNFEVGKAPIPASTTPTFTEADKKFLLNSHALASYLATLGFNKDTKLAVPDFVWKGNKATVVQYLRGLFLTDATVQATDKGAATMVLSSVSKPLLESIQILLINLGIISRVTKMRDASERLLPDGNGGSKLYPCAAVYRLQVTSTEMCAKLECLIGLGEARNNSKFLELVSKTSFRTKPKYQATFTGLEVLPNEDAYCLTVDSKDHAWTANGLITHNTEITLATNKDRTAVCCLSSINAAKYDEWKDDPLFIADVTEFLDNVLEYFIQNAIYACTKDYDWDGLKATLRETIEDEILVAQTAKKIVERHTMGYKKAVYSAKQERAIGIGLMGLDSYFLDHELAYESREALTFTDTIFKHIKTEAVAASLNLGEVRGEAPDMVGTGRRNSHLMAIAPTATNSTIAGGKTPALEKRFENIYTQKTKSGTFEVVEPALVRVLDKYGINTPEVIKSIKDNDGSVQHLAQLSDYERMYLRTAFEVDQMWVVEHAAVAQQYVCQAISVNLFFMPDVPRPYVNAVHLQMWKRGLKSRYYVRTKSVKSGDAFADKLIERINTIDYSKHSSFESCLACEG